MGLSPRREAQRFAARPRVIVLNGRGFRACPVSPLFPLRVIPEEIPRKHAPIFRAFDLVFNLKAAPANFMEARAMLSNAHSHDFRQFKAAPFAARPPQQFNQHISLGRPPLAIGGEYDPVLSWGCGMAAPKAAAFSIAKFPLRG